LIKLSITDFSPPIIIRAVNFIRREIASLNTKNTSLEATHSKVVMLSPFDEIPLKSDGVRYVMDIGANVGDTAMAALNSFPLSKVICFEPVELTYKTLKKNLRRFEDRIDLHQIALSNKNGSVEINLTTASGANSIQSQSTWHKEWNPQVREIKKEIVEVRRLDDMYKALGVNFFDIVKIDVEGLELSVLEGGQDFFKNHVGCILIEIAFMRDSSLGNQAVFKIFALLNELGFSLSNIFSVHRAPSEKNGLLIAQCDCVFIKNKNNPND